MTSSLIEQTGSTVAFRDFPVQHNIDKAILVHKKASSPSFTAHQEAPSQSKLVHNEAPFSSKLPEGDGITNKEEEEKREL